MKIAIVTFKFLPRNIGGTEIAANEIASHLRDIRNEVKVFTTADNGFDDQDGNDNVIRIKENRPIPSIIDPIFNYRLVSKISKFQPDIIISFTHYFPISMALLHMKRIPIILSVQGSDVLSSYPFKRIILSMSFSSADHVIALSETLKSVTAKYYKGKVSIISNGVNVEKFSPTIKKTNRIEIDPNYKYIIYVGRLIKSKGILRLPQILRGIRVFDDRVRLLVVGTGADREELLKAFTEEKLQDSVVMTGSLSREDLASILPEAQLLVLPSYSEGIPLVVLEAMAAGLPIVCSNVGGLPDLVKNSENGFLIDPNDIDAFIEKINFLVSNNTVRKEISERNLNKAQEFSWSKIAEHYLSVIDPLIIDSKSGNY
jgi:glycosyltransferase involved in cell wall biosynthesis